MTELDLWGPRVAWPNHFDSGEVIVVPPFAFAKSRTHCIAIELDSKTVTGSVELDDLDPVLSFAADCHSGSGGGGGVVFLTAHRSSLIRVYHGAALEQALVFKSNHNGPVISMHCSVTERRLLTVGVAKDVCLKVWDIEANTCLKSIRPLAARPTALALAKGGGLVCLGNVEGRVQVYEAASEYKITTLTKHVSPVAALKAHGDLLVSAGRDEIVVLWDLKALAALKVIPTFESVESIVFSAADGSSFLTGGSKGKLRLWNSESGKELDSARFAEWSLDGVNIGSLAMDKSDNVHFVQDDLLLSRPGKSIMSLNRNEINDMALVKEKFLVVAGNSSILKVYQLPQRSEDEESEAVLGRPELSAFQTDHEDAIVHLSSWIGGDTGKFISVGKENHINVWRLKGRDNLKLLHTCAGHSAKITAVKMVGSVVSSSDEHGILKVWLVPDKKSKEGDNKKLSALKTVIAHQKEVCCLDACADKQLLVSGSLDKSAKVFNLQTLDQVAVLSGHRRGVSAVKISAFERIMATGCQDSTIKLWELNGFTCFKTLEGQQSHVLSLSFSALNMLHSTGNDGVHYVWNIHASAPKVGAFEGHDGQIWSALSRGPKEIITAGTDGKIVFWTSNADAIAARKEEETRLKVQNDQTLQNCILKGKTEKALKLALKMSRPKVAHNLLIAAHEAGNLGQLLDSVDVKLAPKLLDYVLQWNANSRFYVVAQFVQRHYLSKNLDLQAFGCTREKALKLMAYNEKHAARLAKLNSRFAIVDLLLRD